MKIDRTNNAIRNVIWGYIYRVVAIILPFMLRTVIIRHMGAVYAGVSGLFTSILQILNLSELGFGVAIVYSMYEPIARDDKDKVCALLNAYRRTYRKIGIVITVIGICICPFIKLLVSGDYPESINLYYVYFLFLLNTSLDYFMFLYRSSLINAFQRNDLESKSLLVVSIMRYGLEIIAVYITRAYYLILYIEIGSTVLLNMIRLFITSIEFKDYKASGEISELDKRAIRGNVAALICHKVGGTVLNSVDTIVISAYIGVAAVSDYGNYYYIISALESIILILFAGLTAGIGNSFAIETPQKNELYFRRVLFFNAWIVIIFTNCFAAACQDFVSLWVGRQYLFNSRIMVLFASYFFVHSIRRTIITFRDGAGMWKDNKWQPIVSAVANLVINIMLVQAMGVYGVLLSSILCMVLIDIPWEAMTFCRVIRMRVRSYIISLICYSFISVIIVGSTMLVCSLFHFSLFVNIGIKISVAAIISVLSLCGLYRKNDHYYYYKNLIVKKILEGHTVFKLDAVQHIKDMNGTDNKKRHI